MAKKRRVEIRILRESVLGVLKELQTSTDGYDVAIWLQHTFDKCKDMTGIAQAALWELLRMMIGEEDSERHYGKNDAGEKSPYLQLDLFGFADDDHLVLGGGKRIACNLAKLEHVQTYVNIREANFAKQQAAIAATRAQWEAHKPYLERGLTLPESRDSFRRDHPGMDI